jgi:hypothetical protein
MNRWAVASCAIALALAPVTSSASEPRIGSDDVQPRLERGRRLLISGGVIGGVGLLATTLGFGILGGIHMGNPGPGMSLEAEPGEARQLLRTANSMMLLGSIGASLLVTGAILAATGGHQLRRARGRVAGFVGPRSLGLVVRF